MRHIRYTKEKSIKDKKDEEIVEEESKVSKGFFGGMSKTTKYILIGLLIGVVILIIYLIYRSSRVPSVVKSGHSLGIKMESKIKSDFIGEKDLDIVSNASYSELAENNYNYNNNDVISETGTIDDIIIDGPQTGMPIGNLRYVYF